MLSTWPIIPNRHHGSDAVDGFAGPKSVRGKRSSLGWTRIPRHAQDARGNTQCETQCENGQNKRGSGMSIDGISVR